MNTLFFWLLCTGLLLLLFLILLFTGIRRKKLGYVYAALIAFFLSTMAGLYTGYFLITRSYHRVTESLKPRTGPEIYTALFGNSIYDCTEVINHKDPVIPRIDCCIWLEFRTCPQELKRLTTQQPYHYEHLAAGNVSSYEEAPAWWQPAIVGDSVHVFRFHPDSNHDRLLLFNADSTHAMYCDMAE